MSTAVDNRRHSNVTHIATATSVCDFRDQVILRCPEGTIAYPVLSGFGCDFGKKLLIPSKHLAVQAVSRFTSEFNSGSFVRTVLMLTMQLQFFVMKENMLLVKEHSTFVSLNDKIRDQGFPVVVAE